MSRICNNCGTEILDNDVYCPVCGIKTENTASERPQRLCGFCGAALSDNDVFCSECGRKQGVSDPYVNNKSGENKAVNPVILGVMIGGGVVLIAAVVIIAMLVGGKSGKDKPDNENSLSASYAVEQTQSVSTISPTQYTAVVSEAPTPIPVRTPVPVTTSAPVKPEVPQVSAERNVRGDVQQNGYLVYTDNDYSFSCEYPASFRLTVVESDFYRYTLSSPDGSGSLYICATHNNNGRTPANVRDNFIASYGGSVDYQNSGSDWCAVRTLSNGRYHYGYFKLTNGLIRGFEMHFPSSQFDLYDGYVNDIYSSITYY